MDQLACPIEGAVAPHQLVHGDCVPVMAEMAPETVDVAVTSPPYNLGLTYRQYRDRRGEEAAESNIEEEQGANGPLYRSGLQALPP